MESIDALKKQIRKQAVAARAALTGDQRRAKSLIIAEKLFASPAWNRAQIVCVYVWFKNEVQTDAILDQAWQEGKTVAVPFCCNDQPEKIRLYRLDNRSPLEPGAFGILEPAESWRNQPGSCVAESQIDLYVVPGVGFDGQNNRIGWGGGYYDRLLSRSPNAAKVALAFRCQLFDCVPVGEFDIPLDQIITD